MVFELKGAGRDESLRMDLLLNKWEVGQVTRVWTHNDPKDYNWQHCDCLIVDEVPKTPYRVPDNGPVYRLRVPVLQQMLGNKSGYPWTPRVGDNEGRIWLEAQKTHAHRAHIHFKAEKTGEGANLSLRSAYENAAHIELFGVNDPKKGRILIKNEDIGNFVDIKETDEVEIDAAKILRDGDVEITGSCTHHSCSCQGTSGTGTGTGAQQAIEHGLQDPHGDPLEPSIVSVLCTGAGGSAVCNYVDAIHIYVTVTLNIAFKWICRP